MSKSTASLAKVPETAAVKTVTVGGRKFKMTNKPAGTTSTSNSAHHMGELMAQMEEMDLFDSLRTHLRAEKLFADNEDWETATIRMDMLKALARKWKMHGANGFWKTHNTKLALAKALHQYVRRQQLAEARKRGKRKPLGSGSGTSSSEDAGRGGAMERGDAADELEALKRIQSLHSAEAMAYGGDLFGTAGDYSGSLVYLSRHSRGESLEKAKDPFRHLDQRPGTGGLMAFMDESDGGTTEPPEEEPSDQDSDEGYDIEGRAAAASAAIAMQKHEKATADAKAKGLPPPRREGSVMPEEEERAESPEARDRAKKVGLQQRMAKALRDLSRNPRSRLRMLEEHAAKALLEVILDTTSAPTRLDCADALCNLSATIFPSKKDAMLETGVVRALSDIARGAVTRELRCLCCTALYNLTCDLANREKVVMEGAVRAFIALAKPVSAGKGGNESGQGRRPGKGGKSGRIDWSAPPRPEIGEDAYCLWACMRGLCNLSTVPQGCVALVESGALSMFCNYWFWLVPELQQAVTENILFNVTKSRGYAVKVAEEGAVRLLGNVINSVRLGADARERHTMRLAATALCRLTRVTVSAKRVLAEEGVRAIMVAAVAAARGMAEVAEAAAANGKDDFVDFTEHDDLIVLDGTSHERLEPIAVQRRCVAAISRLLGRKESCDPAAIQGAVHAVASLVSSDDPQTRRHCAISLCNVFQVPSAAICAVRDGALKALVGVVERDSKASEDIMPIVAQAFFNASSQKASRHAMMLDSDKVEEWLGKPAGRPRSRSASVIDRPEDKDSEAGAGGAAAAASAAAASGGGNGDRDLTGSAAKAKFSASVRAITTDEDSSMTGGPSTPGGHGIALPTPRTGSDGEDGEYHYETCVPAIMKILAEADRALGTKGYVLAEAEPTGDDVNPDEERHPPKYTTGMPLRPTPDLQVAHACIAALRNLSCTSAHHETLVATNIVPLIIDLLQLYKPAIDEEGEGEGEDDDGDEDDDTGAAAGAGAGSSPSKKGGGGGGAFAARFKSGPSEFSKLPLATLTDLVNIVANLSMSKECRTKMASQNIMPILIAMSAGHRTSPLLIALRDTKASVTANPVPLSVKNAAAAEAALDEDAKMPSDGELRKRMHLQVSALMQRARMQCALAVCNLTCDRENHSTLLQLGVMPALISLCSFGGDGDAIRESVATAFHSLSDDVTVSKYMLDAGVAPTLVALCSSNAEVVRHETVGTLYNLSMLEGEEDALIDAGAVKSLMVLALLRSHDALTQRLAMESVHNLMTAPLRRVEVLHQGVIYGLQNLAVSKHLPTQRSCATVLYRIACDPKAQALLVSHGGVRSVMVVLTKGKAASEQVAEGTDDEVFEAAAQEPTSVSGKYRADGEPLSVPPTSTNKDDMNDTDRIVGSLFAGVLSEVSKAPGNEDRLVREGAVDVLVRLCNRYTMEEAGNDAAALVASPRSGAVEGKEAAAAATPASTLSSGIPIDGEGAGGRNDDVNDDEALVDSSMFDAKAMRGRCVCGLYHLSSSRQPRHRERMVLGGAVTVFRDLACLGDDDEDGRRMSVLGLINLLWGDDFRKQILKAGATRAFVSVVSNPHETVVAYACAVALHYASCFADGREYLQRDGAVAALLGMIRRADQGGISISPKDLKLDTGMLAVSALANMAADPAVVEAIVKEAGVRVISNQMVGVCAVLNKLEGEEDLPGSQAPERIAAVNAAAVLLDSASVVLAYLSEDQQYLDAVVHGGAVTGLAALFQCHAVPQRILARCAICLRNMSWSRQARAAMVAADDGDFVSALVLRAAVQQPTFSDLRKTIQAQALAEADAGDEDGSAAGALSPRGGGAATSALDGTPGGSGVADGAVEGKGSEATPQKGNGGGDGDDTDYSDDDSDAEGGGKAKDKKAKRGSAGSGSAGGSSAGSSDSDKDSDDGSSNDEEEGQSTVGDMPALGAMGAGGRRGSSVSDMMSMATGYAFPGVAGSKRVPITQAAVAAHRRVEEDVFERLRGNAAQTLCHLSRDEISRPVLVSAGVASGLIAVTKSPTCSAALRTKCLRALCLLSTEVGEGGEGVEQAMRDMIKSAGTPGADAAAVSRPDARVAAEEAALPQATTGKVVDEGAVAALIAGLEGVYAETFDVPSDDELEDDLTPLQRIGVETERKPAKFKAVPMDSEALEPEMRTAGRPDKRLYERARAIIISTVSPRRLSVTLHSSTWGRKDTDDMGPDGPPEPLGELLLAEKRAGYPFALMRDQEGWSKLGIAQRSEPPDAIRIKDTPAPPRVLPVDHVTASHKAKAKKPKARVSEFGTVQREKRGSSASAKAAARQQALDADDGESGDEGWAAEEGGEGSRALPWVPFATKTDPREWRHAVDPIGLSDYYNSDEKKQLLIETSVKAAGGGQFGVRGRRMSTLEGLLDAVVEYQPPPGVPDTPTEHRPLWEEDSTIGPGELASQMTAMERVIAQEGQPLQMNSTGWSARNYTPEPDAEDDNGDVTRSDSPTVVRQRTYVLKTGYRKGPVKNAKGKGLTRVASDASDISRRSSGSKGSKGSRASKKKQLGLTPSAPGSKVTPRGSAKSPRVRAAERVGVAGSGKGGHKPSGLSKEATVTPRPEVVVTTMDRPPKKSGRKHGVRSSASKIGSAKYSSELRGGKSKGATTPSSLPTPPPPRFDPHGGSPRQGSDDGDDLEGEYLSMAFEVEDDEAAMGDNAMALLSLPPIDADPSVHAFGSPRADGSDGGGGGGGGGGANTGSGTQTPQRRQQHLQPSVSLPAPDVRDDGYDGGAEFVGTPVPRPPLVPVVPGPETDDNLNFDDGLGYALVYPDGAGPTVTGTGTGSWASYTDGAMKVPSPRARTAGESPRSKGGRRRKRRAAKRLPNYMSPIGQGESPARRSRQAYLANIGVARVESSDTFLSSMSGGGPVGDGLYADGDGAAGLPFYKTSLSQLQPVAGEGSIQLTNSATDVGGGYIGAGLDAGGSSLTNRSYVMAAIPNSPYAFEHRSDYNLRVSGTSGAEWRASVRQLARASARETTNSVVALRHYTVPAGSVSTLGGWSHRARSPRSPRDDGGGATVPLGVEGDLDAPSFLTHATSATAGTAQTAATGLTTGTAGTAGTKLTSATGASRPATISTLRTHGSSQSASRRGLTPGRPSSAQLRYGSPRVLSPRVVVSSTPLPSMYTIDKPVTSPRVRRTVRPLSTGLEPRSAADLVEIGQVVDDATLEVLGAAAIVMQRIVRGYIGRHMAQQQVADRKEQLVEEKRRKIAAQRAQRSKEGMLRDDAAVKIQAVHRGKQGRQRVHEERAATHIQAGARGMLARKEVAGLASLHRFGLDYDPSSRPMSADGSLAVAGPGSDVIPPADRISLGKARRNVLALTREDFNAIADFTPPPELLLAMAGGICLIMGYPPRWATAQRLMRADNFQTRVLSIEQSDVPRERLVMAKELVRQQPELRTIAHHRRASVVNVGPIRALSQWVGVMTGSLMRRGGRLSTVGVDAGEYDVNSDVKREILLALTGRGKADKETVGIAVKSAAASMLASIGKKGLVGKGLAKRRKRSKRSHQEVEALSLQMGRNALRVPSRFDFDALAMKRKPPPQLIVLSGVLCTLLHLKPTWASCKRAFIDPDFVQSLELMHPGTVPQRAVSMVRRMYADNRLWDILKDDPSAAVRAMVLWAGTLVGDPAVMEACEDVIVEAERREIQRAQRAKQDDVIDTHIRRIESRQRRRSSTARAARRRASVTGAGGGGGGASASGGLGGTLHAGPPHGARRPSVSAAGPRRPRRSHSGKSTEMRAAAATTVAAAAPGPDVAADQPTETPRPVKTVAWRRTDAFGDDLPVPDAT